jgi:hypothetical protein
MTPSADTSRWLTADVGTKAYCDRIAKTPCRVQVRVTGPERAEDPVAAWLFNDPPGKAQLACHHVPVHAVQCQHQVLRTPVK